MRRIRLTIVYTQKSQLIRYNTTGNWGREDIYLRRDIGELGVDGPKRVREWELQENGVFHVSIPTWIIHGPDEWSGVYTRDDSPPPLDLQIEKHGEAAVLETIRE